MSSFACPDCGKTFPMKPEYAGRAVKCRCGKSFTAPFASGSSNAEDTDSALAARYGVARTRRGEDDEPENEDGGAIRKFVLPLVFLAAGGAIAVSQITWVEPEIPQRIQFSPTVMLTILFLASGIAIAAVMVAAKFLEYPIGNLNIAVMKIASVAVLATSLTLMMVFTCPG